jgi:hypothetical protein
MSWANWLIFGAIHNLICEPRSEIGRPVFVASYGGSLKNVVHRIVVSRDSVLQLDGCDTGRPNPPLEPTVSFGQMVPFPDGGSAA